MVVFSLASGQISTFPTLTVRLRSERPVKTSPPDMLAEKRLLLRRSTCAFAANASSRWDIQTSIIQPSTIVTAYSPALSQELPECSRSQFFAIPSLLLRQVIRVIELLCDLKSVETACIRTKPSFRATDEKIETALNAGIIHEIVVL